MAGLTEEVVRHLRQMKREGRLNVMEASRCYGVNAETIRRAMRGETWNSLSMPVERTEEQLGVEAAASLEKLQKLLAKEKERLTAPGRMIEELRNE